MRKSFLLFSALWAIVILYYATLPTSPGGTALFPHIDKVFHFIAFGILAGLLFLSKYFEARPTIAAATAYGLFIELIQLTSVGRQMSLFDILADTTGATAAVFLISYAAPLSSKLTFFQFNQRQV